MLISNNATDAANDIDISAGAVYSDDGSNYLMVLPAGITKRVDANWAAGSGQGGLDTGSVVSAADPGTSYSFWLIANSTTGDPADAIISASPTNPKMPTGYDKKKYIGSMIYTTSWKMFTQFGNHFFYTTKIASISNVTLGATETPYTLPIPLGRRVLVKLNIRILNPVGSVAIHLRSDVETGQLPSFSVAPYATLALGAINQSIINQVECWSNIERQVLAVMHANSCTFGAAVVGWVDPDIGAGRLPPAMSSPVSLVGSRIDAICDCGGGVVIAAARDTLPGRIYRSTDYGRSFSLVATATGTGNASVFCVASDMAGTVYAILSNGDLWKSTDNGESWAFKKQVTTSGGPCYGVVVAADGSVIVTDRKDAPGAIWRSTDGGACFTKVLQEPGGSKGIYRVVTCRDGLVADSFTGVIYRSTDNGATWAAAQTLTSTELYGLCYCEDGILLCGDLDAKVYRSTDDGLTWTQIAQVDGASDDIGYLGNGRVIYTTYTSKKRLYYSDNFGDQMKVLGRCPTAADDWADHVATVNEPGRNTTLLVSTGQGYVFRVD